MKVLNLLLAIALVGCGEVPNEVDVRHSEVGLPNSQDLILSFQSDPSGSVMKYRDLYLRLNGKVGHLNHDEKVVLVILAGEMIGAGDLSATHEELLFSYLDDRAVRIWALQGLQYLSDSKSGKILLDSLVDLPGTADSTVAFNSAANRFSRQCSGDSSQSNWCMTARVRISEICASSDLPEHLANRCSVID